MASRGELTTLKDRRMTYSRFQRCPVFKNMEEVITLGVSMVDEYDPNHESQYMDKVAFAWRHVVSSPFVRAQSLFLDMACQANTDDKLFKVRVVGHLRALPQCVPAFQKVYELAAMGKDPDKGTMGDTGSYWRQKLIHGDIIDEAFKQRKVTLTDEEYEIAVGLELV